MEKYKVAIVLLLSFLASSIKLDVKIKAQRLSLLEEEINVKLKLHNKPAVKTIKSEDGDIIDCVDIYKQPAFDNPALQNHTIQRIPKIFQEHSSKKYISTSENLNVFQPWQKRGSCPRGTIPIRRIIKDDLLRATSLLRFGSKFQTLVAISQRHLGVHLATAGSNFIGAQADINVWNPKIDLPDDSTTAQMWLKAGNGLDFESIEAGWMVNPGLYGDNATRLFSYWTKDSYNFTGCYDLTCSGFVQTSTTFALGGAITPISSSSGQQFLLNVGIFLDELGHWWLKINNNIPIGYWPAELFVSLKHSATLVQYGGQVISSQINKSPHTKTEMGSGTLPKGQFGIDCFIRNIRIKDNSLMLKYPQPIDIASQEPNYYNGLNDIEGGDDPAFYFGGHG